MANKHFLGQKGQLENLELSTLVHRPSPLKRAGARGNPASAAPPQEGQEQRARPTDSSQPDQGLEHRWPPPAKMKAYSAQTGVAQRVEHCPAKGKVSGASPGQGTGLDCGFGPSWGTYERSPVNVSLPPFLSPFLCLKINETFCKIACR